jgi:hypothetical protein
MSVTVSVHYRKSAHTGDFLMVFRTWKGRREEGRRKKKKGKRRKKKKGREEEEEEEERKRRKEEEGRLIYFPEMTFCMYSNVNQLWIGGGCYLSKSIFLLSLASVSRAAFTPPPLSLVDASATLVC